MARNKRVKNYRTNGTSLPSPNDLEYGELAIQYNANDPKIIIKDSNGQLVTIAGSIKAIALNGEIVGTDGLVELNDIQKSLSLSDGFNPSVNQVLTSQSGTLRWVRYSSVTIGTNDPVSTQGSNGDIYLKTIN